MQRSTRKVIPLHMRQQRLQRLLAQLLSRHSVNIDREQPAALLVPRVRRVGEHHQVIPAGQAG